MTVRKFGREDHEANSEKIARLFRECSGIGGEAIADEAWAWPTEYDGPDLTANNEKIARFNVEMCGLGAATTSTADPATDGTTRFHPAIADASAAADFVL